MHELKKNGKRDYGQLAFENTITPLIALSSFEYEIRTYSSSPPLPPLKFGMSRCCKPSTLNNCCTLSRPRGLVKISVVCQSVGTYTSSTSSERTRSQTKPCLECQLRYKICHCPWSELCNFHSSSTLDDSHWRDLMEQWYRWLQVTCKNDVQLHRHQSIHNCSFFCKGKGPCINAIFCSCC